MSLFNSLSEYEQTKFIDLKPFIGTLDSDDIDILGKHQIYTYIPQHLWLLLKLFLKKTKIIHTSINLSDIEDSISLIDSDSKESETKLDSEILVSSITGKPICAGVEKIIAYNDNKETYKILDQINENKENYKKIDQTSLSNDEYVQLKNLVESKLSGEWTK